MTAVVFAVVAAAVIGAPRISIHPEAPVQGDVVVVEISPTDDDVEDVGDVSLAVTSQGSTRELPSFSRGARRYALLGIDAEAKASKGTLTMKWSGGDVRVPLPVATKSFPTEKLKVEGKYVDPPADVTARIIAEKERLERLWRQTRGERLWSEAFRRPVDGVPISIFGLQRVFNGQRRSPHNGVDFKAAAGVRVAAANDGEVVIAEDLYFTGNTVVLDHGLGLYTVYAHLSEISVRPGDDVRAGSLIGKVGATGRATGPHLHWGARLLEARVDPMQLLGLRPLDLPERAQGSAEESDHGGR